MAFGILYGFVCGCFLSLSPAVSAQLYGSGRLAGLSGLMLLFNLPGMFAFNNSSFNAMMRLNLRQATLPGRRSGARS